MQRFCGNQKYVFCIDDTTSGRRTDCRTMLVVSLQAVVPMQVARQPAQAWGGRPVSLAFSSCLPVEQECLHPAFAHDLAKPSASERHSPARRIAAQIPASDCARAQTANGANALAVRSALSRCRAGDADGFAHSFHHRTEFWPYAPRDPSVRDFSLLNPQATLDLFLSVSFFQAMSTSHSTEPLPWRTLPETWWCSSMRIRKEQLPQQSR